MKSETKSQQALSGVQGVNLRVHIHRERGTATALEEMQRQGDSCGCFHVIEPKADFCAGCADVDIEGTPVKTR